jgi:uncharacterized protein with PIN domain
MVSEGSAADAPLPPRWLADEMLGRLTRYLRFLGQDTEYVRGGTDSEIALRAGREGRILLTRDRQLASRVPGAVLLRSGALAEQLLTVRATFPQLELEPRFDRCSECNGGLVAVDDRERPGLAGLVPESILRRGSAVFRCSACGHLYWEGSHTARVREFLTRTTGNRPG